MEQHYIFVCVCVCFPSFSIQGLSYTRVVLSLYLDLSSFSFSYCKFFAIIISSFSPFQVLILFWGKLYFFVSFKQKRNCFSCSLKYLASPFLLIQNVYVSSRLFNLYIVIKSPFSLLSLVLSVAFLLIFPYMTPSYLLFSLFFPI